MFGLLLLGFLCGIAFTLAVLLFIVLSLANTYQGTSLPNPVRIEQFTLPSIPKVFKDFYSNSMTNESPERAVVGLNLVFMFLFQELKNTEKLRRWFKEKIEVELHEIKCHPALQYVLRDLKLNSFDLGDSLPLVRVVKFNSEPEIGVNDRLETVDLILDISYTGHLTVSLEALVSFDRNVMFSCKIMSLAGQGRLRFTRQPYTNWSFSFISEPTISMDLKSNINGRNVPQIVIPLLKNQIKRIIRKKHTLPAYKMRIKPFFNGAMYKESMHETITIPSQALEVTVTSASRLVLDYANSSGVFAVVSLGSEKYVPQLPYTEHAFNVTLSGPSNQRFNGLSVKKSTQRLIRKDAIIIDKVKQGSQAAQAGIAKGDVITHINHEPLSVISVSHARSLLTNSNSDSVSLRLSRYKARQSGDQNGRPVSTISDTSLPRTASDLESVAGVNQLDRKSPENQQEKEKRNISRSPERDIPALISSVTSGSLRACANSRITSTVACDVDVKFAEQFNMKIESNHIYLNIALFSLNKSIILSSNGEQQRSCDDSLIGYASISVHDILVQCGATPKASAQMPIRLTAPPDLEYRPSLSGARELDLSKCYGDVTLQFYAPENIPPEDDQLEELTTTVDSEFADIDIVSHTNPAAINIPSAAASDSVSTDTTQNHSFREQAFTHAVSCNFCMKKIWFKKAMRCEECHMITHKKCVDRCQMSTTCSHRPIVQSSVSQESLISQLPTTHPGKAARASSYVLGKLRRRKARNKSDTNPSSDQPSSSVGAAGATGGYKSSSDDEIAIDGNNGRLTSDYQALDSFDSSSEDDAEFEIQFMKDYLSKQGQTAQEEDSDELVIIAAKQMGKELFASLEIEERKTKLEAMVDKLQLEIQMVSAVRDEHHRSLKSTVTAPQRQLISSRIKKADEKMQALAVLLVHYYSGLQDCAEQIEKGDYVNHGNKNEPSNTEYRNDSAASAEATWDSDTEKPTVRLEQRFTDSSSTESGSLDQTLCSMNDVS